MRVVYALILFPLLFLRPAVAQDFTPFPCSTSATELGDPRFEALSGARAFFGNYVGGVYQIEVPDNWNGELVAYQHGLVSGPTVRVQVPALRAFWVRSGYAWAASSYRCNGPGGGQGVVDTNALVAEFSRITGRPSPSRTWAVGTSNGGGGVLLALRYFPALYVGGLAMCPADAQTLDFRLAVARAAEVISTVDPLDATKMTEVFGSPGKYTRQGQQLASIQIDLSGGPRPFAIEGLADRFLVNVQSGVVNPAVTSTAVLAQATNLDTVYRIDPALGLSADSLNLRVRRQAPDLEMRTRSPYHDAMPFDLRIGRPVITIHGTGDLYVPITLERGFKQAAERAGTSKLLVQRIMRIPGHCRFSEPEQIQAFEDLVKWVKEGVTPEGDDVMADFRDAGRRFTNPLRPGDPGTLSVESVR